MAEDKEEFLRTARERFAQAYSDEGDNRKSALDDIKFGLGEQWSGEDKQARSGRPTLTINKIAPVKKQIIGEARKNRARIKVRPVDGNFDPRMAELYTGLIRNIENMSDADAAYDMGFEQAVSGGLGYWRVLTDYADDTAFEQDILIKRIVNPFSVYFDQSATEPDYSDAQFCFVVEQLEKKEYERKYPGKPITDWEGGDEDNAASHWLTKDKVRVAEYWYKEPSTKHLFELADGRVIEVKKAETLEQPAQPPRVDIDPMSGQPAQTPGTPAVKYVYGEGMEQPQPYNRERKVKCHKIRWCKTNGQEIIEGPQDWAGKFIPIVPCLGEEVWLEGRRILRSAIIDAKDPQRLYNWARSNAVETLALAPKQPWVLTSKQIEGHEKQWQQASVRPMPYLLVNSTGEQYPQRQGGSIPDTGALQEAVQAADDIKATTGIYDASLGARGNETSGKAIIARQRQGDVATFLFSDNQVKAIKHTGRILVDLIPKIYDTERVVRLMGDDGKEAWAKINITDPATGKVIANDLSVGRYDIVVDAGPGYATKRQEAADGQVAILQAAPQFAPILIPEIVKNLDWPGAQDIAAKIEKALQPPPQQPDPKAAADTEKTQAETMNSRLEAAAKMLELQDRTTQRAMMQSGAILPPGFQQPQAAGNSTTGQPG